VKDLVTDGRDNVKIDLKGMRCEVVDWIQLAQTGWQWQGVGSTVLPRKYEFHATM